MTPEQKTWKQRLLDIGVEQAEFARMLDLRYSDMCLYLNCKREPRATIYEKIKNQLEALESK